MTDFTFSNQMHKTIRIKYCAWSRLSIFEFNAIALTFCASSILHVLGLVFKLMSEQIKSRRIDGYCETILVCSTYLCFHQHTNCVLGIYCEFRNWSFIHIRLIRMIRFNEISQLRGKPSIFRKHQFHVYSAAFPIFSLHSARLANKTIMNKQTRKR